MGSHTFHAQGSDKQRPRVISTSRNLKSFFTKMQAKNEMKNKEVETIADCRAVVEVSGEVETQSQPGS